MMDPTTTTPQVPDADERLRAVLVILGELDAAHEKARNTMFLPTNWGYLDAAVWGVRQRLRRALDGEPRPIGIQRIRVSEWSEGELREGFGK